MSGGPVRRARCCSGCATATTCRGAPRNGRATPTGGRGRRMPSTFADQGGQPMAEMMATVQQKPGDQPMQAVHESEREWEMLRFPGQWSKMLFHPSPERPTEPNGGFVRYDPGAHHPLHRHDFAQIWYVLEGSFTIGGLSYGPGTMIHHPDPH